jgi:hypothetical protein
MHQTQPASRVHQMVEIVFYSWQSDLPNATNRGFIERALENAAKAIRADNSIQVEPTIDRDTLNVPGAPDIASTILGKMENSQVFVCDVSIINSDQPGRHFPNPNVLIELGYAIKTLGWERIIMVMNTAYGGPELLPFDLRMRRVVAYNMPDANQDRAPERRKLEAVLEEGLRIIFEHINAQMPGVLIQQPSIGEQAQAAIQAAHPDRSSLVRRFMNSLVDELEEIAPDLAKAKEPDEDLVLALDRTLDLVTEFARVAEVISMMNDLETATTLYKGFDRILEHYYPPSGFSGPISSTIFDFWRFIGHELFAIFFSFLIREGQWGLIADLLQENIYIENAPSGGPGLMPFTIISSRVQLLDLRNDRLQLDRYSVHADLLNKRHTEGELGRLVPMNQLIDADCFLYLRAAVADPKPEAWGQWQAWSTLYMGGRVPRYLIEAYDKKFAQTLLRPLSVSDVEVLRSRLTERAYKVKEIFQGNWSFDLLERFNAREIGTR